MTGTSAPGPSPVPERFRSSSALDLTVDGMLRQPSMVARRLATLAEQETVMGRLFPPPVLTRRQRLVRRARRRVVSARERVARRIAPWLS